MPKKRKHEPPGPPISQSSWWISEEYENTGDGKIRPISASGRWYPLNAQHMHKELLLDFSRVRDVAGVLRFLSNWGALTDSPEIDLQTVLQAAASTVWLLRLSVSAKEDPGMAVSWVKVGAPQTNWVVLLERALRQPHVALPSSVYEAVTKHNGIFPCLDYVESLGKQKRELSQPEAGFVAVCQQFMKEAQRVDEEFVEVSIRPEQNTIPNFVGLYGSSGQSKPSRYTHLDKGLLYSKDRWSRDPFAPVYAIQSYLQRALENLMSGMTPTLEWQCSKDGCWFLCPSFRINSPWQALNYALYCHVGGSGGFKSCERPDCPEVFVPKRSDKDYCGNTCQSWMRDHFGAKREYRKPKSKRQRRTTKK